MSHLPLLSLDPSPDTEGLLSSRKKKQEKLYEKRVRALKLRRWYRIDLYPVLDRLYPQVIEYLRPALLFGLELLDRGAQLGRKMDSGDYKRWTQIAEVAAFVEDLKQPTPNLSGKFPVFYDYKGKIRGDTVVRRIGDQWEVSRASTRPQRTPQERRCMVLYELIERLHRQTFDGPDYQLNLADGRDDPIPPPFRREWRDFVKGYPPFRFDGSRQGVFDIKIEDTTLESMLENPSTGGYTIALPNSLLPDSLLRVNDQVIEIEDSILADSLTTEDLLAKLLPILQSDEGTPPTLQGESAKDDLANALLGKPLTGDWPMSLDDLQLIEEAAIKRVVAYNLSWSHRFVQLNDDFFNRDKAFFQFYGEAVEPKPRL